METTRKRTNTADRAKLTEGFDALPEEALLPVPTAAAVLDIGESTFWVKAKRKTAGFPKIIKLSTRTCRVRVGDIRAYLRHVGGPSLSDTLAAQAVVAPTSAPVAVRPTLAEAGVPA